ncbi:rCG42944, isoform CRA_c [Rattus norvegicus]|uniref:RCG42944, isoform CRA_c n=1 Tax=Rattus norvegicus TaxID=10116 RepID=A6JZY6_RAT|nr:rCG42944, isoform CRA_c [Rattus norvegicus]
MKKKKKKKKEGSGKSNSLPPATTEVFQLLSLQGRCETQSVNNP